MEMAMEMEIEMEFVDMSIFEQTEQSIVSCIS